MEKAKNYVYKRDSRKEEIHLDKITSRIQKLCYGLNMEEVDPVSITLKVIGDLYPGITTVELDTLAANTAVLMSSLHPDYGILAARLAISNLQKETKKQFTEDLYKAVKDGKHLPFVTENHYQTVTKNANRLNSAIVYDRDFSYDYFSFKFLERNCLLKINKKTVERPQHMFMRVAIGIHGEDIDSAIDTYNYMSEKYFVHSINTLFYAGTTTPNLCPSYLLTMPDDSLDGIYDCITQCGLIGNTEASVGVSIQNIRAKGTRIAGTGGISNGLVPMLRVFNNSAILVEEHPESQTIYLEPWHPDVLEFLNLKKFAGKEEYRAPELMYALWVPDLFMKRVKDGLNWSLMCPHNCPNLPDVWGEEFENLYEKYESEKNFVRQIPARDLWRAICETQIETGTPFILYKDACNKKSNQQNLGTVKNGGSSGDLVAYTSPDDVVACPTASLALDTFVNSQRTGVDFDKLKKVAKILTKDLDKILDVSSFPLVQAHSNKKHRAIAVGVHGLADVFLLLGLPFNSEKARLLNRQIFETIYFAALESSSEIAETSGKYESFEGSPISKGLLQFDLWGVKPTNLWDWQNLKEKIDKHGVRNSLLTSVTFSETYQILDNNPGTEPYSSFVNTQNLPSAKLKTVNRHLMQQLSDRGLWNNEIKDKIIESGGSIQQIPEIPKDLKEIYKTVWEMSQKVIIDMAADRAPFIDHSQATNIYLPAPNYLMVNSMHFYGWQKGLKTGLFTLKTNYEAVSQMSNPVKAKQTVAEEMEDAALACSLQNPGACEMCSA